jgi:radical SAM protein with 4Fe4S-binding SPASM domain
MPVIADGEQPWIGSLYTLPVGGRWLLYSAESGLTALLNGAALRRVRAGAGMEEMGLGEFTTVKPRPGRNEGAAYQPAFLGLIPTRNCNLSCAYCDFRNGAAGREVMTFGLATGAIGWFADDCERRGIGTLDVHLFGGEPLTARDVVEVIVHRTRALAGQRRLTPHLEIATNGVYDRKTAQFVADHFDMVVLSVDGEPGLNDQHRCRSDGSGSYEAIAGSAEVMSAGHGGLILRVCVSQQNVGSMAETVGWFGERFAPSAIDFEPMLPAKGAAGAGLLPPAPMAFAAGFLEARAAGQSLGLEVTYSGSMLNGGHGYCPAQEDGLIVSPEGRISSCYLNEIEWQRQGMDLNVGKADAAGQVDLFAQAVSEARSWAEPAERCKRCFCQRTCRGGCLVHHRDDRGRLDYDDYCLQTRVITATMLLEPLQAAELQTGLTSGDGTLLDLMRQPSDRLSDWRCRT